MAIKPLDWYCQPVADGVWGSAVSNALGAFTPCATQSIVIGVSHLVLICLCVYRIWLTYKDLTVKKYSLRSKYFNYFLGFLAAYCTAEPLVRLIMRISVFNLDGQAGLAPYEVVSLIIESLAWLSVLIMIGVENKVYICEFRWFVRFALIYALVGDAVMLNLVISVKEYYERSVLYLYLSEVVIQGLFGVLLLFYIPSLDPFPGYTTLRDESIDDSEYVELPGGEQICPERHANIIASMVLLLLLSVYEYGYFERMTHFWD